MHVISAVCLPKSTCLEESTCVCRLICLQFENIGKWNWKSFLKRCDFIMAFYRGLSFPLTCKYLGTPLQALIGYHLNKVRIKSDSDAIPFWRESHYQAIMNQTFSTRSGLWDGLLRNPGLFAFKSPLVAHSNTVLLMFTETNDVERPINCWKFRFGIVMSLFQKHICWHNDLSLETIAWLRANEEDSAHEDKEPYQEVSRRNSK